MYTPAIDTDIPLADFPPTFEDLHARVDAAFASLVAADVADVYVTDEDEEVAREILVGMTKDKRLLREDEPLLSSPGVVVKVKALLSAYDERVVESAAQIRTFVTNKLILETENPNASVRLKALELLGKISDVGLFTDKTEITMRHRPTAELEQLLRERLSKTLDMEQPPVAPLQPLNMDLSVFDLTPKAEE